MGSWRLPRFIGTTEYFSRAGVNKAITKPNTNGRVFPPGYIYLHINLVPKTYVQALNKQQQNTTNTLFNPS